MSAALLAVSSAVTIGAGADRAWAETDAPLAAAFSPQQIRPITFPVHSSGLELGDNGRPKVYWSDTFGAPRSGGRSHVGVDMLGPKMTPLLAAVDGTITWMRSNGNNMLVITDDDGWEYWYIHLNNDTPGTDDGANNYDEAFGPGIETGATVVAGQVVGYMGDSGNAESSGSHLHFEIETPAGQSLNPTLSVDDALARIGNTEVDSALVGPFESFDQYVQDLNTTLLGRELSAVEREALAQDVLNDGLFASLEDFVGQNTQIAAIDRLYFAVFNRLPDIEGYNFWLEQSAAGQSLDDMSEFFATSPEFEQRYGSDNFEDMLDQIYREMFNRDPDEPGKAFWLEQLNDPNSRINRGTIVAFFSDGEEARGFAGVRGEIVALTALFDDRMPTTDEVDAWTTARESASMRDAATQWFITDRADG